jgi:uncharacterized membrane protein
VTVALTAGPSDELAAGIVLGVGLGGFVDGIVIHQLLGWHHMLSGWVATESAEGMRTNMIGDGVFHLVCLLIVVIGIYLLRASRRVRTHAQFTGLMLAGWGGFNLIEGIVDHQILGLHHVRPGPDQTAFDIAFLLLGAVLLVGGLALSRPTQSRR